MKRPVSLLSVNLSDYLFYQQIKFKNQFEVFALYWIKFQFKPKLKALRRQERSIAREFKDDPKKIKEKIDKIRNKAVKQIVFQDALRQAINIKNANKSITSFFKRS